VDPDGEEQTLAQKNMTQLLARIGTKDKINVLILRTKIDNGHNGKYFRSNLYIMNGKTQILNQVNVQSTADHSQLNQDDTHQGMTIPTGNYTGKLLEKSGTYLNPIQITGDGVGASEMILIHPNVVTNSESPKYPNGPFDPPGSLGCQMLNNENFNEVMDILHTLGFKTGDEIDIQILNKGYEP
jgi:hypothetical protein